MLLVDARRLTGPNHLGRAPLVMVEVALAPGEAVEEARAAYAAELGRVREALGLPRDVVMVTRAHAGGAAFAYEAPIDTMLAHAEASEWAALSAVETLAGRPALPLEPRRAELARMVAALASPRLLELAAAGGGRDVPVLWDDEAVSLGEGSRSVSFSRDGLPQAADVDWASLGRIPVALVTGTNGKTTSARLLARVAAEAGVTVGAASSGGITVGGERVEDGDWTGPAAARAVLRRTDVALAVLETARGGILRRGLGVDVCDVALVTNVSDDHLGLSGIDDLAAMVAVKGVCVQAVRAQGTAVLNAHDARLVALGQAAGCNVTYFADLDGAREGDHAVAARAVIEAHRALGRTAVVARGGAILIASGEEEDEVARVAELPITFGGAARYNVENVLGAVGAAHALGVPKDAITRGVRAFAMHDNAGRGQLLERRGVRVLLDYAHNPDGVRAVMQLVRALYRGQGRLTVVTGSPGDRSDQEIEDVARVIWEGRPDRVLARELGQYLRGRQPGEVPAILRRALLGAGMPASAFAVVASEREALERAFADASPGDFVAVLVHVDHAEVEAFLAT